MIPAITPNVAEMPSTQWGATAYLGGAFLTGLVFVAALWLSKRRWSKSGTEDVAYEVAQATIKDQRAELVALRDENSTLRRTRSEIEASLLVSEANVKIASQAAQTAAEAATANYHELLLVREKLQKAEAYIHTLRTTLARHGHDIPTRPEHAPT